MTSRPAVDGVAVCTDLALNQAGSASAANWPPLTSATFTVDNFKPYLPVIRR